MVRRIYRLELPSELQQPSYITSNKCCKFSCELAKFYMVSYDAVNAVCMLPCATMWYFDKKADHWYPEQYIFIAEISYRYTQGQVMNTQITLASKTEAK